MLTGIVASAGFLCTCATFAFQAQAQKLAWALPRKGLNQPFPKTALIFPHSSTTSPLQLQHWDGDLSVLPHHATTPPSGWAAMMVNGTQMLIGCGSNWFRPLHPNSSCGYAAGYSEQVIFWNRTRFTTPPHWQDIWNVVRFPGRRALYQGARSTLEIALLADGVPVRKLYRTLSTPEGVNRAFRQLDRLRPYIVWWRDPHTPRHLMQHHAILIGVAPVTALPPLLPFTSDDIIIPDYTIWKNHYTFYDPQYWIIPGILNDEDATNTLAQLDQQAPIFPDIPSPFPTENFIIDSAFWSIHHCELETRFRNWLTYGASKPQTHTP